MVEEDEFAVAAEEVGAGGGEFGEGDDRWTLWRQVLANPSLVVGLHLAELLDGVGGGVVVDDSVVCGAEEDQVGVRVTVGPRHGMVAARAVGGAGEDVGFLTDGEWGISTVLRQFLLTAGKGAPVAGAGPEQLSVAVGDGHWFGFHGAGHEGPALRVGARVDGLEVRRGGRGFLMKGGRLGVGFGGGRPGRTVVR